MINKLGLKRHEQFYIIFALCAFVIPRIIDCIINKLLKMGEFHTLLPAGIGVAYSLLTEGKNWSGWWDALLMLSGGVFYFDIIKTLFNHQSTKKSWNDKMILCILSIDFVASLVVLCTCGTNMKLSMIGSLAIDAILIGAFVIFLRAEKRKTKNNTNTL